jgi:hypothetical protein
MLVCSLCSLCTEERLCASLHSCCQSALLAFRPVVYDTPLPAMFDLARRVEVLSAAVCAAGGAPAWSRVCWEAWPTC